MRPPTGPSAIYSSGYKICRAIRIESGGQGEPRRGEVGTPKATAEGVAGSTEIDVAMCSAEGMTKRVGNSEHGL